MNFQDQVAVSKTRADLLKRIRKLKSRYRDLDCDLDYAKKLSLEDLTKMLNFLLAYYQCKDDNPVHKAEAEKRHYRLNYKGAKQDRVDLNPEAFLPSPPNPEEILLFQEALDTLPVDPSTLGDKDTKQLRYLRKRHFDGK